MIVRSLLKAKKISDVSTVKAGQSVIEAATLLHRFRIGALVVVDDNGRVSGILSERDLARGLAQEGPGITRMVVKDLMTQTVLVCTPDDSVEQLMEVMTTNRVRHLPVIENDRLTGIVTIGDLVKSRLEEARLQVESLRDYVGQAGIAH